MAYPPPAIAPASDPLRRRRLPPLAGAAPWQPDTPQPPGYAETTPFSQQQNLIGTQIAPRPGAVPGVGQDVGAARATTGRLLGSLEQAPSRQQTALDFYRQLEESTLPEVQQKVRAIGQRAAQFGRLGMGEVGAETGDVFREREANLARVRAGLASETAGQEFADRLARLQAGLGVTQGLGQLDLATGGQRFGEERARREELRGERGFQTGLEQTGIDRAIQQRMLEENLLGSEYGRRFGELGLVGQLGFQEPSPTGLGIAEQLSGQGEGTQSAIAGFLQSLGRGQTATPESVLDEDEYYNKLRAQQIAGNPYMAEIS